MLKVKEVQAVIKYVFFFLYKIIYAKYIYIYIYIMYSVSQEEITMHRHIAQASRIKKINDVEKNFVAIV